MKPRHEITVSEDAVRQGRQCGLHGSPEAVEARVKGIAAAARPIKHVAGNLAYGPFLVLMQGTHVLAITMTGPRVVDERPVSQCKLCRGLMVHTITTTLAGQTGLASRPCPRAFNSTSPL